MCIKLSYKSEVLAVFLFVKGYTTGNINRPKQKHPPFMFMFKGSSSFSMLPVLNARQNIGNVSSVCLVVEQADVLLNKDNAKLLRRLEDRLIVLAAAGRGDVLRSRPRGAVDIVSEWELPTLV